MKDFEREEANINELQQIGEFVNFDAEDFDDYNVLQRDMQVDGGLRPVSEEDVINVRRKAAKAVLPDDPGGWYTALDCGSPADAGNLQSRRCGRLRL